MEDLVQFKVFTYWSRDAPPEVRRFGIEKSVVTSYTYLNAKLQDVFPALKGKIYTVMWKDEDGDEVTISSDDEMVIALSSLQGNIYKLSVKPKIDDDKDMDITIAFPEVSCGLAGPTAHHIGVVCDNCETAVTGYRYKCTVCDDFDLCSRCEAAGNHPEHCMVRVPAPSMPRAMIRAAIKRSRHFLKTVAQAEEDGHHKRNRRDRERDRSADKKRDHHRDHHRGRARPSWLDTFATYMNEFANLAGDIDLGDLKDNLSKKDDKKEQTTPPNTAEPGPSTSQCPFKPAATSATSCPFRPSANTTPTPGTSAQQTPKAAPTAGCPFKPPVDVLPLGLNIENIQKLLQTYMASLAPEQGQGDRKTTDDAESVKSDQASTSDRASVKSNDSGASNEVKTEPSLDKADDWMMVNQDKDLMDAYMPTAPEQAPAPAGFNLPQEFQHRVNISGGNLYPPLNMATAVLKPQQAEGPKPQASPAAAAAPAFAAAAATASASAPAPAAAAAPAQPRVVPAAPKPTPQPQRRSHPSPHIEASIQQMLSMGFTNDGGWLTQLLESKDGNIAAVLDLLTPVNPKRK